MSSFLNPSQSPKIHVVSALILSLTQLSLARHLRLSVFTWLEVSLLVSWLVWHEGLKNTRTVPLVKPKRVADTFSYVFDSPIPEEFSYPPNQTNSAYEPTDILQESCTHTQKLKQDTWKITKTWKGKSSEPNLQGFGFHIIMNFSRVYITSIKQISQEPSGQTSTCWVKPPPLHPSNAKCSAPNEVSSAETRDRSVARAHHCDWRRPQRWWARWKGKRNKHLKPFYQGTILVYHKYPP